MYGINVGADLASVACPTLVLHATGHLRLPFAEGRRCIGAKMLDLGHGHALGDTGLRLRACLA